MIVSLSFLLFSFSFFLNISLPFSLISDSILSSSVIVSNTSISTPNGLSQSYIIIIFVAVIFIVIVLLILIVVGFLIFLYIICGRKQKVKNDRSESSFSLIILSEILS